MTAKYPGKCKLCGGDIHVGQEISWKPGQGAAHVAGECLATPVAQPVKPKLAVEDAGVYVMPNGDIVKVKATQDKKRTYAMRWKDIGAAKRLTEPGTHVHYDYEYVKGLVEQVAAEGRKMTLEEAKLFMVKYGNCARCGRLLKAAKSVEQGIGPVCIKFFAAGTTGAAVMVAPADMSGSGNTAWAAYKDMYAKEEAKQEAAAQELKEYDHSHGITLTQRLAYQGKSWASLYPTLALALDEASLDAEFKVWRAVNPGVAA